MKFKLRFPRMKGGAVETNSVPRCSMGDNYSESLTDRGNEPMFINIRSASSRNDARMRAIWSGEKMQLTLMTIPEGESIPLEVHNASEQMLMILDGMAELQMGMRPDKADTRAMLGGDYAVVIPRGCYHSVKNVGRVPLRMLSVYAPRVHKYGEVEN